MIQQLLLRIPRSQGHYAMPFPRALSQQECTHLHRSVVSKEKTSPALREAPYLEGLAAELILGVNADRHAPSEAEYSVSSGQGTTLSASARCMAT